MLRKGKQFLLHMNLCSFALLQLYVSIALLLFCIWVAPLLECRYGLGFSGSVLLHGGTFNKQKHNGCYLWLINDKNIDILLNAQDAFQELFHRVRPKSKKLESTLTKQSKQNSQSRLVLHVPICMRETCLSLNKM